MSADPSALLLMATGTIVVSFLRPASTSGPTSHAQVVGDKHRATILPAREQIRRVPYRSYRIAVEVHRVHHVPDIWILYGARRRGHFTVRIVS